MKEFLEQTWLKVRDSVIAAIRTGTAAAVSWAIAWAVGVGVTIPEGFEVAANSVLFGLAAVLYNLVVSFLERKVHPWFGILVLIPKVPAYTPGPVPESVEELPKPLPPA